jgi:dTMP kinase
MPKLIIAIEGIDGAGKSTVARLLARRLGLEYVKTPGQRFAAGREKYDKPGVDLMERFEFYRDAVRKTVVEAVTNTPKAGIVSDRYVHSLLIYHELALDAELSCRLGPGFPTADHTFMMDVPLQLAMERIRQRSSTQTELFEQSLEFLQRVAMRMRRTEGVQVIGVNRRKTAEQIVCEIIDRIGRQNTGPEIVTLMEDK